MIEVLIADDHPLVIQGLRAVIAGTDDIAVVGHASNGRDAVLLAVEHQPDVAILDLDMPELRGLDATKQIRAQCPTTFVLILTMFDDDDTVLAALQAGAAGYLLKGAEGTHVLTAIRSAAAGNTVLSPRLIDGLTHRVAAPLPSSRPFPELTAREADILAHVALGLTNAEIGKQLHLSAKTVANNVSLILTKLHVTQRGEAIVTAREAGLVADRPKPIRP